MEVLPSRPESGHQGEPGQDAVERTDLRPPPGRKPQRTSPPQAQPSTHHTARFVARYTGVGGQPRTSSVKAQVTDLLRRSGAVKNLQLKVVPKLPFGSQYVVVPRVRVDRIQDVGSRVITQPGKQTPRTL